MGQLAVLVPDDKDLEDLLINSSNEYDTEYLKYLVHYVLNGLSRIIENQNFEKDKKYNYEGLDKKHISLHSKNDVLIGDKKHKRHISLLSSNEVDIVKRESFNTFLDKTVSIFYRRDYKENVRAFGYRLNPRFYGNNLKIHYLNYYKLVNKIKEKHTVIIPIVNSGNYKFLKKFFDSTKLKIDINKSVVLCDKRLSEHKNYGKYLNEMIQITDLFNGIYRIYYRTETDARIHTNLTRLPKVYRKYVTYNNSALVEVDLSNSIIYFLSMLLSNKIDNELVNSMPLLLMFVNTLESLDIKEVQLMQLKAVDGTFYQDFIAEYRKIYKEDELKVMFEKVNNTSYEGTYKQVRKVVKKRILAMIFSETKDYKTEQKIFKSEYPNILRIINDFKDENGYKLLSHILFQLESHFIINEAGRTFNRENYRNAPLFTLHDCLITTKEYGDTLERCMKEVFTNLIGVSPNTEISHWE